MFSHLPEEHLRLKCSDIFYGNDDTSYSSKEREIVSSLKVETQREEDLPLGTRRSLLLVGGRTGDLLLFLREREEDVPFPGRRIKR